MNTNGLPAVKNTPSNDNHRTPKASIWKSLRTGLIVLVGLVVFAYGFQVTQVSFTEIYSTKRQESLTRVIRALAQPDILKYEQVETTVSVPILVPCPPGGYTPPAPDTGESYLVVTPACADARSEVTIEGYHFPPNSREQVYFVPPSEVNLNLGTFETDAQGYFKITAKIPPRESDQEQYVRTITRKNVGRPSLSRSALDTWEKIIETVFLALLATAFGIIFAIPVSFIAARNLMEDITSTVSSLALSIIGWPLGMWLGAKVTGWIGAQTAFLENSTWVSLAAILVGCGIIWAGMRWALPEEEVKKPGLPLRLARSAVLLLCALIVLMILYLVANLGLTLSADIAKEDGLTGMFGKFINNLSEILNLLIVAIGAVVGGAVISGLIARPGKTVARRLSPAAKLVTNIILGALAGAVLCVLIGAGLDWLYQINDTNQTLVWPAIIGAALGIITAILTRKEDSVPIGIVIYYITRTILNILRAIEALIWVIIFVVWVGIGPFAGVLALSLHTIAALGKLYSEQVESILPGPLEAVKATGATRLQVIVYSVIPQIIPLYISFTMYRWDINVRMSTIIGFAGGGGIGFLLLQNINLLNYRAASTQMVAIAIVVALMDYFSSYMRERVV